jgi:hypothetical protein
MVHATSRPIITEFSSMVHATSGMVILSPSDPRVRGSPSRVGESHRPVFWIPESHVFGRAHSYWGSGSAYRSPRGEELPRSRPWSDSRLSRP